ncbi:aminopeptidase N [Lucilia cuprina]|uniref:aminopeptidase N n=1 Tax=Lucilia cuprina TaxID=7375 RepID=UPI001F062D92|nr:aminopeptidase N [Lucilia cuprina]XP_046805240.1 aminopeptidase N [Lucilia cuprina]XP_046805241.1 aminopeptidase N [Lucilia cuprina]XP_046805242.1 aminopeptidase N [Lucilia cuprina]XP_046805243.1 aminopeptidase N [Lucilia cuprina]
MVTHPHENLNMETQRSGGNNTATTQFITHRRGYTLSCSTLLLLGAFFICTLLTVSFVVYNFATCDDLLPNEDEDIVCTAVPTRHKVNEQNATDATLRTYEQDVRLPTSIKPLKYNISLEPYLYEGNFTFNGEIHINILVLEDCYNVTMHAIDLDISKNDVAIVPLVRKSDKKHSNNTKVASSGAAAAVANEGVAELRIRKQYLLEAKQFFIIELYDKLLKNTEYVIKIKFSGLIQDYLQGFYRSSYKVQNETRWLASTQFQATDARRAFPCFDEPALKANFTLNIARPKNMSTVSNMPILRTRKHETLPDYEWDYFDESLPMSTYLVAYSISDFSKLSNGNFSVWARHDAIQSASYALSVGPKILKFLEEFFDLKFPLPKMDMIALPDFQAGAMENWGLITYRETTMLFEEGVSASTYKQRVASVVGHELAHQWFGNLVTPSWWSDIWLNEGFASYMEYLTVDAIEPEWRTMDQFVVNELQNVFQLDALSTSHKISVEVGNPEEITEIFDRISYGKGSTIIRMMSHFLTSNVFRRGLNRYLKDMAYSSAEQDDLWHSLTLEAKLEGLLDRDTTVKDIMDTWTLQVGFPVVHISKHPNTNVIRLEQQRFVYESSKNLNNETEEEDPLWWIPITYTTSEELDFENTRPLTWIPRSKIYEIESRNLTTADWFIFNIQQSGYYRINYELSNWQTITSHLMNSQTFKQIAPSNRAQLIDDAMNLARGGYLSYEIALNLTRYLINEDDHAPWKAAVNAFQFIDSMFVSQGDYDLFKNYLLKLVDRVYNELGFRDSKDENNMLEHFKRVEILNMACHLGHQGCISDSVRHFQNWVQVPNPDANNPISPNLRGIVYCAAVQYGTEAEWEFAFERYLKTSVSTEKEIILTALGCSKEPWILSRYLRYSISGDMGIRKQDVYRVFAAVSSNVVGQKMAFDFIRNNWEDIKTYLGSSMSNFNTILKFATKRINSKYHLNELEAFVTKELKDNSRLSQQIVEHVQVNVNWMNKNYQTILEWLRKESKRYL